MSKTKKTKAAPPAKAKAASPSPATADKSALASRAIPAPATKAANLNTPQVPALNGSAPIGVNGKAAIVINHDAKPQATLPAPAKRTESESADEVSGWLPVNLTALAAALVLVPKNDTRYYLCGGFLHRTDQGDIRLIATDGARLLAQTLEIPEEEAKPHKWLDKGIIIPRALLERIKAIPGDFAYLQLDSNTQRLVIRDRMGEVTLKGSPIQDGKFPEYQRVITGAADALTAQDREPGEASCFNPKYLADAGKLAGIFGVTAIGTYPGDGKGPGVITFPKHPSALYIVVPTQTAGESSLGTGTARLIGAPGLSRTIAALKAHATRHNQAAKAAKDDKTKEREKYAAERLLSRIADLQNATVKALPAPKAAAPAAPVMPKMVSVMGPRFTAPAPSAIN